MTAFSSGTVALFSTSFVPYSQTFIYDEVRAHTRYEVDVFCKERINEDRFPYDRYYAPPSWARKIYENLGYWPAFDRKLNRDQYDVVHAHFGTGAVYALPYVVKEKLPFVVTFWGNDVGALIGSQRYHPRRWRYVLYSKLIFRHADLMLCVSKELQALVTELSGRGDAVRYYSHGVDTKAFRPRENESTQNNAPEILLVGRFTEKKGHRHAIRAFAQVLAQGREAHLTFIGGLQGSAPIRRYVADHGLTDHVNFAGELTHEETARRLASATIVLVPSVVAHDHDREGSPTVAKEASASGVPVIATWHAGLPEIVDDGKTGFLVSERNSEKLADRIITLLDNSTLRLQFGRAGRLKMKRDFELFERVRKLESYYDSVR